MLTSHPEAGFTGATLQATRQRVRLPASKRVASKQATAVTRSNENAGQSATSSFDISDELKNCTVLSQATYWPHQFHWASVQVGYYTSQRVASKVEETQTFITRSDKSPESFLCFIIIRGEFKSCWWTLQRLSCQVAACNQLLLVWTASSPTSSFLDMRLD
jgi:hypothetical protein